MAVYDHNAAMWTLDHTGGTAISAIRVEPNEGGCDECRVALYAGYCLCVAQELPRCWEAGGSEFDALQPLEHGLRWRLRKVGPCRCTGECLTVTTSGVPAQAPPPNGATAAGMVAGRRVVYCGGAVGLED